MFDDPVLKTAPETIDIQKDIIKTTVSVHRPSSSALTAGIWITIISLLTFLIFYSNAIPTIAWSIICGLWGLLGLILILVGIFRKFGSTKILFSEESAFTIIDKKSLISPTKAYHFPFTKTETYWQIYTPAKKNSRDYDLRVYDKQQDMKITDLSNEEVEWLNRVIEQYVIYSGYGLTKYENTQELDKLRQEEIEKERKNRERIQREKREKREKKRLENEEDEHNEWSANHAKDYKQASSYAGEYQESKNGEHTVIDVVDSYEHHYEKNYEPLYSESKKKKNKNKKRKR